MQPNQQYNPYDFILNEQPSAPQQPVYYGGGGDKKRRILIAIVFSVVLIMVLVIGVSLISSIGRPSVDSITSVRAYQAEIERVIKLGEKDLKDPTTKNNLASLKAAIVSDRAQLDSYLTSASVKISESQLASKKDSKIDSALDSAKLNNTYDAVLLESVNSLANDYFNSVNNALANSKSNKEMGILQIASENLQTYAGQQSTDVQ